MERTFKLDESLRKALEDLQLTDTGETDERVKAHNAKVEEETRLAREKWEAQIKELEGRLQRAKEDMDKVKQAKVAAERAEMEDSAEFLSALKRIKKEQEILSE